MRLRAVLRRSGIARPAMAFPALAHRRLHTTPRLRAAAATASAAPTTCEYLVIGGGIAGASTSYYLSEALRKAGGGSSSSVPVVLLERESQPGVHSTGRSAALYSETYGNETIRALTTGSRAAFLNPPSGFVSGAGQRVLAPRGCLYIGSAEQRPLLDAVYRDGSKLVKTLRRLSAAEVLALCPVVRPEFAIDGCVLEPDAEDIDVAAVHAGFLKGAKAFGTRIACDSDVASITAVGGGGAGDNGWDVRTASGAVYRSRVVINAAGAWADRIGALAGAAPIGLTPKRRTIIVFRPPETYPASAVNRWPFVMDSDEQFYFKPDAGQLWGSPADETPSAPCDAQPDELDMAVAIERLQGVTTLTIPRLSTRWAGLRSFVSDKSPVVGWDRRARNFLWVAGQGGYGIQTCFAMGELSAALAQRKPVPPALQALGLTDRSCAPDRPALLNATLVPDPDS